jgi:hypothetical protein
MGLGGLSCRKREEMKCVGNESFMRSKAAYRLFSVLAVHEEISVL